MSLQYISDSTGQTTGVYIPINEWIELKNKFKGIEAEEVEIPEWHKQLLNERLGEYKSNPDNVIDFDAAMDDIESTL